MTSRRPTTYTVYLESFTQEPSDGIRVIRAHEFTSLKAAKCAALTWVSSSPFHSSTVQGINTWWIFDPREFTDFVKVQL